MPSYNADLERLTQLRRLFDAFLDPNAQRFPEQVAQLESKLHIYLEALSDIAPDELSVVVTQCVRECKFFPTISELVEKHRALNGALNVQTSADAWISVQRALREVGYLSLPRFRNPLTARAVEAMGWRNICESEQPGNDRAQFERIYNSLLTRQTELDRLLPASRAMLEQSEVNKIFRGLADQMRISGPSEAEEPDLEMETDGDN